MNPFMSRFPVESREDWFGNQQYFEELDACILQRVNTAILGVQGSGKTSLLRTMFSVDYCTRLAEERKILICEADLSAQRDGDAICRYLAEKIRVAAQFYLKNSEWKKAVIQEMKAVEGDSDRTRLSQLITLLHRKYGYFVVLLMNHFERFTSSPMVTMDHHEVLRSLVEDRMLQCVVATDYDLSQDSLPPNVPGSYLLQKFTKFLCMRPLSQEAAVALLQRRQEGAEYQLSLKLMETLFRLSGGIPWVLETAAEQVYANLEANGGTLKMPVAREAIYQACFPLFQSWCKYLTEEQTEAIRMLADQAENNAHYAMMDFTGSQSIRMRAVAALKNRGILRQVEYTTRSGSVRQGRDYELQFNSLLFQRFCREGLAEETARENPFEKKRRETKEQEKREKKIRQHEDIMRALEELEQRVKVKWAQRGGLGFGGNTIIQVVQILDMLQATGDSRKMFAQRISNVLKQPFSLRTVPLLPMDSNMGEEVFAQQSDEVVDQIGRQLLQDVKVDEEQDLVSVTPAELHTLDIRFRDVRQRRVGLTDVMLESQSERCQFYLKLSVVVEDALELLGPQMEDYSPQLVLYGKALEQSLRDNFYELFHRDAELSVYSPVNHMEDPTAPDAFRNKPEGNTLIGNYEYLIAGKTDRLETLCKTYPVQPEGEAAPASWRDWWRQLQNDIDTARRIRNLMGHADENSPTREKLNQMCELLIGDAWEKGILDRITVGKRLALQLFPQKIPQQAISKMVGTVCEMECTARKTNGGLRGITCSSRYAVNISPRMVQRYLGENLSQGKTWVGRKFRVRLLEYKFQDNREFFSAELVSEAD